MPDFQLTELQKNALKKMNEDSVIYGQQNVTEVQLEQWNQQGMNTTGFFAEENERIAQKLREQMMVDQENARLLQDAYPELYQQSLNELNQLEQQANISAKEKVQQDFFGQKKRSAKNKREKIKTARDLLEKARYEAVRDQKIEAFHAKNREINRLPKQNPERLKYETVLKSFTEKGRDMSVCDMSDYLYRISDHYKGIERAQTLFLSKSYQTIDKKTIHFQSDSIYRDMAAYTVNFGRGADADPEVMEHHAKNIYIVQNQKTIHQEPVNHEEQMRAYREELLMLRAKKEGCQQFLKRHPEYLKTEVPISSCLRDLDELRNHYTQTQVVGYVLSAFLKSPLFSELSKEEQAELFSIKDTVMKVNLLSREWTSKTRVYEREVKETSNTSKIIYKATKKDATKGIGDQRQEQQNQAMIQICKHEQQIPYATKEFLSILKSISSYMELPHEQYETKQGAIQKLMTQIHTYLERNAGASDDHAQELYGRIQAYDFYFKEQTNGSLSGYEHAQGQKQKNPKAYSLNYWKDVSSYKLFPHEPSVRDVHQRLTEDCYLLSSLSALAYHRPGAIRDAIRDNGDGTVTVRFYDSGVTRQFGQDTSIKSIQDDYLKVTNEEKKTYRTKVLIKMLSELSTGDNTQLLKKYLSEKKQNTVSKEVETKSLSDLMDSDEFDSLEESITKKETKSLGDLMDSDEFDSLEESITKKETKSLSDLMDSDEFDSLEESITKKETKSLSDLMDSDETELLGDITEETKQKEITFQPNYESSVTLVKGMLKSNSGEWYESMAKNLLSENSIFQNDMNDIIEQLINENKLSEADFMEQLKTKFLDRVIETPGAEDGLRTMTRSQPVEKNQDLPIYVTVSKEITTIAGTVEANATDSLWVQMIEKAYVTRYGGENGYQGISNRNSDEFLKRFLHEDYIKRSILEKGTNPLPSDLEAGELRIPADKMKDILARAKEASKEDMPSIEDIIELIQKEKSLQPINKDQLQAIQTVIEKEYGFVHRVFSGKYTEFAMQEFDDLTVRTERGETVVVGVAAEHESQRRKSFLNDTGIRFDHAYAVLNCFTQGSHHFVTLRDPYALFKREYKKNTDKKGNTTYEKVNASQLGLKSNNSDGLFFMEFNDFLSTFNTYTGIANG